MSTINISIPIKLKEEANSLVKKGYYVSFSDLVRDSLRALIEKNKYNVLADKAKRDEREGKAVILKTNKDIDSYFDNL